MDCADIRARVVRSNEDRYWADHLEEQGCFWTIVLRFYSAMHRLEAYMLTKPSRFQAKTHAERWRAITQSPELKKQFQIAYKRLHNTSEQVRYEAGFTPRPNDYENALRDLDVIGSFVNNKIESALARAP